MERPTFHESWHRVANLRPRLRASVNVTRQHFRGQRWHVLEDPASGQFYRLSDAGYDIVGRLDGRTTVDDAWRASAENLGDDSLTQGETIGLLGQLSMSNLLRADVPGDTAAMFERQRERRGREARGYLASLLFLRIPLIDPDAFLNRWAPLLGWIFGPIGAAAWLVLLIVGGWHLAGRAGDLLNGANGVLAIGNLPYLYLTYAVIKALHEFGHALACKVFGMRNGRGGEVHTIGVMILIFLPIPYVDASSSWGFRSRVQRMVVAAAGIIVELACAAVAAVVWARTAEGTVAHAIAYNAIFLASVSTVLFNGNPLLRYDGYYIFADLIGVPNLAKRSQDYLTYLVKRYAWGVRRAMNPAHNSAERVILGVYGVAAGIYRVLVYIGIALFIAAQQFLLGAVLLLFGAVMWCIVPIGRLIHYLLRHHELDRTRGRALLTTAFAAAILLLPAAVVPVTDAARAEGIAEPVSFEVVHAKADGFIEWAAPTGAKIEEGASQPLVVQRNSDLARRRAALDAEVERLRVTRALAFRDDPARAFQIDRQVAAAAEQEAWVNEQIASLRITSTVGGEWISPSIERMVGTYIRRGTQVGLVADRSVMQVRAVLGQREAGVVIAEGGEEAEVRAWSRPEHIVSARHLRVLPAGQRSLPSASLGIAGGGATPVKSGDREGVRTTEDVFEAWLGLPADHGLLPGQRVVVRFTLKPKPLLRQAVRSIRQVLQEKFNI